MTRLSGSEHPYARDAGMIQPEVNAVRTSSLLVLLVRLAMEEHLGPVLGQLGVEPHLSQSCGFDL